MNSAWLPLWILGGPFLGVLFLCSIYKGGTSAASAVRRRSPVGSHPLTGEILESAPTGYSERGAAEHSDTLDLISRLSGPVAPGAISELSAHQSPGAISRLSAWRSPGAISKLSGHRSPGAISRLSGRQSPGAIARLSAPRPVGAVARLSTGFYVSTMFGLPLLTDSQSPSEPDDTLLISER